MRYSYEFKLMCVELYHSDSYPDIPEGLNPDTLKSYIRKWAKLAFNKRIISSISKICILVSISFNAFVA